jgi:hypothetical protein
LAEEAADGGHFEASRMSFHQEKGNFFHTNF